MKIEKKVISNLNKCYAMSELTWEGDFRMLFFHSFFVPLRP